MIYDTLFFLLTDSLHAILQGMKLENHTAEPDDQFFNHPLNFLNGQHFRYSQTQSSQ